MILHLRLPNKFLLGLFSLSGAVVAGAVLTFHGDAPIASKGRAVNVPVIGATYPNYNGATSTTGRGSARGKSGRGGSYVSQMLTLAAGSYKFPFSLEDRNFGFGANGVESKGVDVSVNGVQIGSFTFVSVNLGNPAAGSHKIAFAGDPSISQRPGQPPTSGHPPTSGQPSTSGQPPTSDPPSTSDPPPTSVPDSGGTFLLMLCSAAGLLIMGRLASRQLEK
jgi:hypothetical protein